MAPPLILFTTLLLLSFTNKISNIAASNPRLRQAYVALQAWKKVIYSDPNNFTSNWVGPSVCNYTGIYCAPLPIINRTLGVLTVAGVDLNHGDIAGFLPRELGLLSDLSLLHLNSNRFCGILPPALSNLTLLYELDLSNNRFVGPFPRVVLSMPSLKYLDLRFNDFEGQVPPRAFTQKYDAIILNNNRFTSAIPSTLGASTASVVVVANNHLGGCLPGSIANLANSLEELLLSNTRLTGCLPPEVGYLYKLRVLDVSFNKLVGEIPYTLAGLGRLEQLNLAHNMFSGDVREGVCILPNLKNLTLSYNFFCGEEGVCSNLTASRGVVLDDRRNCLPKKKPHVQRTNKACHAVLQHPVDCFTYTCARDHI